MGSRAFAVTPTPTVSLDSAQKLAFAAAARVAVSHGLRPTDVARADAGWSACFARESLFFCGKPGEGEIQFRMWQWVRLSPLADRLGRDFLNDLSSAFGPGQVRECNWKEQRDPARSGCAPKVGARR